MSQKAQTTVPKVEFHTLPHADGSARYDFHGYSILCSVNGPVEAQRRDELPEETFLDVVFRHTSGAGAPRERLLETLVHKAIRPLLHTKAHPRSLTQITLQLLRTPAAAYSVAPPHQSESILPILAHLVNAAIFALLDGNIPMISYGAAVLLAILTDEEGMDIDGGQIVEWPNADQVEVAQSVHVCAFDSNGALVLVESEGDFALEEWSKVVETAKSTCVGTGSSRTSVDDAGMLSVIRGAVGQEVLQRNAWRNVQ